MISFQDLDADLQTILGINYVNDAHNPSARIKYLNFAIQKISETIFRNNFIFIYIFSTDWTKKEYPIPTQFSTKQIFIDGVEQHLWEDWVLWKDSLNNIDKIAVYPEQIIFPDTSIQEVTILYRGTPTLINSWDTSTTQINLPSSYRRAIVPLAAYYAFRDVKDNTQAAEQLSFYKEEIASVASAFADPDENRPKRLSANHTF